MEKELAQRILKEVAKFAIDCWDRDYVKYDLKENIYSLDASLYQKYNEQLKLCINDAIEILNQPQNESKNQNPLNQIHYK